MVSIMGATSTAVVIRKVVPCTAICSVVVLSAFGEDVATRNGAATIKTVNFEINITNVISKKYQKLEYRAQRLRYRFRIPAIVRFLIFVDSVTSGMPFYEFCWLWILAFSVVFVIWEEEQLLVRPTNSPRNIRKDMAIIRKGSRRVTE